MELSSFGSMVCAPPGGLDDRDHFYSAEEQAKGKRVYKRILSREDAADELHDLHDETERLRKELQRMLREHGNLILSRWTKKSKDKRHAILSTVHPFTVTGDHTTPKQKHSWITPYMCWSAAEWMVLEPFVEDRMRFFAVLHNRTAYPASSWAILDTREATSFAWEYATRLIPYTDACVSICADEYGQLTVPHDVLSFRWAQIGFPRAFLTFTAQNGIMNFLYEVCLQTLDGVESPGAGNHRWLELVNSGLKSAGSDALWNTYTSPAFAPPNMGMLDPDGLVSKAKLRYELAVDEMEQLQTDARYMQHWIRRRMSRITNGPDRQPTDTEWQFLAQFLLLDTMDRAWIWHQVLEAAERVQQSFRQENGQISHGACLPPTTSAHVNYLGKLLLTMLHQCGRVCDWIIPMSTSLSAKYATCCLPKYKPFQTLSENFDPDNPDDRLACALATVRKCVLGGPRPFGYSDAFQLLESQLAAYNSKAGIDSRGYDHLSDIMALDEMFQSCARSQVGHVLAIDPRKTYEKYLGPQGHVRDKKEKTLIDVHCFKQIGGLMRSLATVPFPSGRRDMNWWETAARSRERLTDLWKPIRDEVTRGLAAKQGKTGVDEDIGSTGGFLQIFNFANSPEYLARLDAEQEECKRATQVAEQTAQEKARAVLQQLSLSEISKWNSGDRDESKPIQRKQTKAKAARAREEASISEAQAMATVVEAVPLGVIGASAAKAKALPIALKQDSISIISKMFATEDRGAGGSVRWAQFVQMMADAGLAATSVGGSAVSFSGADFGTIVFHRPHPEPTIEHIMLQGFGKRLHKRFDWSRERFVLREKAEAAAV